MFTLALVGRPNVGKSTLFNRFAGKKLAIVDDTPGVTRDWRESLASLFDRDFIALDTAGLEENFDDSIQGRMRQQTEAAIKMADAILFMVDGRAGVTPLDAHFAMWLRKQKKPVILVVNKCENEKAALTGAAEAYSLGLGEPIPVSAEHNLGMEDIYHALDKLFPREEVVAIETDGDNLESGTADFNEDDPMLDELEGVDDFEFTDTYQDDSQEKPIKIAIIGRPNVGKSTLLNSILQEQRVMTGPEAGITRDAIAVDWEYQGQKFKLVDTAGMRRTSKVQDNIEKMSVADTLRAVRLAQIVILVLDGNAALEKQDLQIAAHVIEEGRALIVAVNKWDAVKDRTEIRKDIEFKLENSLAQVRDIPFVTLSALNNKNVMNVLDEAMRVYKIWNKRVRTADLNRWLSMMESRNAAPLIEGRSNRLKYITQIKTRPPTFAMWVARPEKLPPAYRRYIINGLRESYDIPAVPIRLLVRKSKNPFA